MENQPQPPEPSGVPLLEGWMLGVLLYPYAMQQVTDHPPANDDE
jgi:hypothetical protein